MAKSKAEQNQEILLEQLLRLESIVENSSSEKSEIIKQIASVLQSIEQSKELVSSSKKELKVQSEDQLVQLMHKLKGITEQMDKLNNSSQRGLKSHFENLHLQTINEFKDFTKQINRLNNEKLTVSILKTCVLIQNTLIDQKESIEKTINKVWYLRLYPYIVGISLAFLLILSLDKSRDAFENGRSEGVSIANEDFASFLKSSPNSSKEYNLWNSDKN